jgi:Ras-related GTP-binding protein C/D
MGLSKSGKTSI